MTAKIKLNAASGGGSFSLQAPSSSSNNRVLTLPDAADGIVAQTDNSGNFSVSGTTTCTGNLKAGTITDSSGSNSSTTAQIFQGRCKAWVNFDGGSVSSPRDSFNVDSITNVTSGKQQINFTNAMANNDYAFFGSAAQANEDNDNPCFCFPYQYDTEYKTTSVRVKTGYHTHGHVNISIANRSFTSIGIFGD